MELQAENLEQLGQILKEVREGRRESLAAAAKKLHLRPSYLEALESGDWQSLPGQTYGRGYLRRYAVHLGLSEEEAVALCDRLQGKISLRLRYFDSVRETPYPAPLLLILCLGAALLVAALWAVQEHPEKPVFLVPPVVENSAVLYPLSAQECLKIVQKTRVPCYHYPPEEAQIIVRLRSFYRLPAFPITGSVKQLGDGDNR